MNNNDLRVQKTYQSLMNAFMKLIQNKNCEDISVREICQLSMIRRGTFYRHFENKYDFFQFIADSMIKDIIQIVDDINDIKDNDFKELIQKNISLLINYAESHQRLLKSLQSYDIISIFVNAFFKRVLNLFKNYLKSHNLNNQLNLELPTTIITGSLVYSLKWYLDNERYLSNKKNKIIKEITNSEYNIISYYIDEAN